MTTAQDHYERLLARHYSWMFGMPFADKVREQAELLREMGVAGPGIAVDLGCGSGFQAVALADLAATRVHAIDTSKALLDELREHAGDRPITTHQLDLLRFGQVLEGSADTIVCMGDTLTHLPRPDDVVSLFRAVGERLGDGGRLVLSWRDLSAPPEGLDRFIPLRATDDKLMVCFLEDRGDTVLIHDLVHVREADGWQLQKSAYPKLKLSPSWVEAELASSGLTVVDERTVRGMTLLSAVR